MTNKKNIIVILLSICVLVLIATIYYSDTKNRSNISDKSQTENGESDMRNTEISEAGKAKNRYCIASHLDSENLSEEEMDVQMDLLEDSGAFWTRFDFEALQFVNEEDNPDFSHFDQIIDGLKKRGIGVVAILPQWGEERGADYKKIINSSEKYAKYAGYLAEYLKGKDIEFMIEAGNEPNDEGFWPGRNPEEYTTYLVSLYDAVKAVDKNIKVISGGVVMYNPIDLKNGQFSALKWLKGLYDAGVKKEDGNHEGEKKIHFDYYGVHMYPGNSRLTRYTREIAAINEYIKSKGDDEGIAITEIGWPTGEDDSGENVTGGRQAELIESMFKEMAESSVLNAEVLCYYSLVDSGDSGDMEESYGLLRFDLTPKPAFEAFKKITD